MPPATSPSSTPHGTTFESGSGKYGSALALLATVFFMWGFATVLNDVLVPQFKAAFQLSYTASLLVQFCFYLGYFIVSLPAARLIDRIGYKAAVVTGLGGMALACLLFIPSARFFSYGMFLIALFLLASAITLLQVAANPYVVNIGPGETASSRLNLVQAFNSLGTTVAPVFGGMLIFGRSASGTATSVGPGTLDQRMSDISTVQLPYVIIALILITLAVVVRFFRLPSLSRDNTGVKSTISQALRHRNLFWGVPSIFLYMICEIGIGSTLINFISRPDIGNMSHLAAAKYVTFFWGGAMIGRFVGAFVMRYVSARSVLAFVTTTGFLLVLIAAFGHGSIAMWALILTGLCHSVMFPTIFSLGIEGLGENTAEGSGLLIMAIVGGAAAILQGVIADAIGLNLSYLLPGVCYLFLLFYAVWGSRPVLSASLSPMPNAN